MTWKAERRRVGLATLAIVLLPLAVGVAPAGAELSSSERTRLEEAAAALQKDQYAYALKRVEGIDDAPLATWVRWRALADDDRPSFEEVARFASANPDWPLSPAVQARAEASIGADTTPAARLAFFGRRPAVTPLGELHHAEALRLAGRGAEATEKLRAAWIAGDLAPAEEQRFLDRYATVLRPTDQAARLDRLLWDGELNAALRQKGRVQVAQRTLAEARIRLQGLERDAEAGYAAVPRQLRQDAGLQYDRMRFYQRRGRATQALALMQAAPAELGRPERWWREQHRALRDLLEQRRWGDAYKLARTHARSDGVPFAEAEFLAGWLALRRIEDPVTAQRHFEHLWAGVGTPISRGRAAYWAGRAAAAVGNGSAAATWYRRATAFPTTFYGQQAALELRQGAVAAIGDEAGASAPAQRTLAARPAAKVAAVLCRLSRPVPAEPFFRHLGVTAADRDALRAVTALARDCGRPHLGLIAARAASLPRADIEPFSSYPMPKERGFQAVGPGLPDPALRLAVARQESLFDPYAASSAGALGLMQLMPATAQATAEQVGLPYARSQLVADPEYNVRLGSAYLASQLARWGGEPALALAAYNAGPSRVARWLEEFGDPRRGDRHDLIDWIESIPFNETRNYVQRVLEGRGVYAQMLRRGADREAGLMQMVPTPAPRS